MRETELVPSAVAKDNIGRESAKWNESRWERVR